MEQAKENHTGIKFIKSPILAALHCKCPRCRSGNMFFGPIYSFHRQQMNKVCENCSLTFEIEPGYFYVAMFVSYAMNVAEMVIMAVSLYYLTGSTSPWLYCAVLIAVSFMLSPVHFRYSRVVLLYWLTPGLNFDPRLVPNRVDDLKNPKPDLYDC
jgi:uncharacterized protein (DUF983 family)